MPFFSMNIINNIRSPASNNFKTVRTRSMLVRMEAYLDKILLIITHSDNVVHQADFEHPIQFYRFILQNILQGTLGTVFCE
jgi:hypothetical protein